MNIKNEIMTEIETVMDQVDEKQIKNAMDLITKDKRLFVLGAGRSGLMIKGFAMRMMHIGYNIFVIGETITPSIQKGDVLIAVSGSGTTSSVVELVEKAKENGVTIIGITSNGKSKLAQLTDEVIVVPGATKSGDGLKSIQLLSTLFDQSMHITMDWLTLLISKRDNTTNDVAKSTHSNME